MQMGSAGQTISLIIIAMLAAAPFAIAQTKIEEISPITPITSAPTTPALSIPDFTKKENISGAMQAIALMTIVSLAPAILIMMTSFTCIVIVLSLLRQALGTQQLPPNQVL